MNARTARPANIVAACVILAAGALAGAWAYIVPIFQAPDEPAHFDYAVSIFSAHRLIRASDGTPDWIASPYTKYLMRATDFERIVERSPMRVPAGYGSRSYFAKVDGASPRLDVAQDSSRKISYVVRLYPFGFYAIEALWMRAVAALTGSIVAVFFGARLLCIGFMMAGLYFNYRTALNLGIPRWTSVALVAAIGFFPLTSYVASYVQPDNLAYALVSAALFFATELRTQALRLPTLAGLGVSLGLLAVTKYQFFVSAAAPIAVLLLIRLVQSKLARKTLVAAIAWFVVPIAVLLAAQHFAVDTPPPAVASRIAEANLASLRATIAQGPTTAAIYVASTIGKAFLDCFVSGPCAATFWQVVGWSDTPIVLFSNGASMASRAVISLLSIACFAMVTLFFARNALRVGFVAFRRHAAWAVRIAVADPVFNAYVCFIAIMFGLYVTSNDAYGASGRHWYPYLFAALLCFAWYAPRALTRRYRSVSAVLVGALLCYSLVASGYALADVADRYYGASDARYVAVDPPASLHAEARAVGVVWPVTPGGYPHADRTPTFSFRPGSPLEASGYALPRSRLPSTIAVVLDEHSPLPVLDGEYLFTVAEATRRISDGYGGFTAKLDTTALSEGAHTVAAYVRRSDGRFESLLPPRLFFLTGADGGFSPALIRRLDGALSHSGEFRLAGVCQGRLLGNDAVAQGSLLLVTGALSNASHRFAGVWLRVDNRPFPAAFDAPTASFHSTVPTGRLSTGTHRVLAYAIASGSDRSVKIADSVVFHVAGQAGGGNYLARPPRLCEDPLLQLASK
jgi:Predicted membrane protein (DUF2142)